eukprot:m.79553 g.79553  ORF g.79553 m.79553 type:complete len:64 (-) comp25226_c0_seq1:161-352(-)
MITLFKWDFRSDSIILRAPLGKTASGFESISIVTRPEDGVVDASAMVYDVNGTDFTFLFVMCF